MYEWAVCFIYRRCVRNASLFGGFVDDTESSSITNTQEFVKKPWLSHWNPVSTCQRVQRQQLSVEADGETRGAQSAVFLQGALAGRLLGAQQLCAGRFPGAAALILKPESHAEGSRYNPDFLLEDAGIIYPQICVIFPAEWDQMLFTESCWIQNNAVRCSS